MFIVKRVSGASLHCINFGAATDPACGSGGMFVQTGDFVEHAGMLANNAMTFYGQEKVEYNAQLCLMNLAVHGLTGVVKSGDEANTFYHDAHNLVGCCDYVMAIIWTKNKIKKLIVYILRNLFLLLNPCRIIVSWLCCGSKVKLYFDLAATAKPR